MILPLLCFGVLTEWSIALGNAVSRWPVPCGYSLPIWQVYVLNGELPPKVGEVIDSTYKTGTAGIYMESCPADLDNIVVFGPEGFIAVDSHGKLASAWGYIKSSSQ